MKNNRNKIIAIRVTEKEHEIISKKAKEFGLNISTFLRLLGLKE